MTGDGKGESGKTGGRISPALAGVWQSWMESKRQLDDQRMGGGAKREEKASLAEHLKNALLANATHRPRAWPMTGQEKAAGQPTGQKVEWLTGKGLRELGKNTTNGAKRIVVEYQGEKGLVLAGLWQEMIRNRELDKEVWLRLDLGARVGKEEFNQLWQEGNRLGVSLWVENWLRVGETAWYDEQEGDRIREKHKGKKRPLVDNPGLKELITTWAEAPWVCQKLYPWERLVENFIAQQWLDEGAGERGLGVPERNRDGLGGGRAEGRRRGNEDLALNGEEMKDYFPWKSKKVAKAAVGKMFEQWRNTYPWGRLLDLTNSQKNLD